MTPSQSRWAALTQATVYYQAPVARGTLLLIGPAVLACCWAWFPVTAQHDCAGPLLREE